MVPQRQNGDMIRAVQIVQGIGCPQGRMSQSLAIDEDSSGRRGCAAVVNEANRRKTLLQHLHIADELDVVAKPCSAKIKRVLPSALPSAR